LLALLWACGGSAPPPIILVSIDTLRADHLPIYGYEGVETPAFDDLAGQALVFDNAYSHMPLTLPAHASMLTGLLPPEHGVRLNMGYDLDRERAPSIATWLSAAGYATGAAVSAFVLRRETGLDAGFDVYEDDIAYRAGVGPVGMQRPGAETLAAALPWLRERAGRPFFFFLHIYEPHRPYAPPEPFSGRFASPYDGEIAAADAVLGELVAELRRLDIYDDALVIVTADHGEGLGDHGEDEHGVFVYQEAMRVPLLIKPPHSTSGARIAEPVQHIDLAPTLLAAAGLEIPPALTGRSLLMGSLPPRRVYTESYYARLEFGWSELRGLVDGEWAYIESTEPELFDLAADPGEQHNLAADRPDILRRYAQELRAIDPRFEPPRGGDEETRQRLEALGYFGGPYSRGEGTLPAPHTQVHLLEWMKEGIQALAADRAAEAARIFSRVLDENPNMVLAWTNRSRAFEALGRPVEALEDMLQAAERSVGAPRLYLEAARLAGQAGRYGDVEALAQGALEWDADAAYRLMVRAEMARRQPQRALEHAERALAKHRSAENLTQAARILAVMARTGEAESLLAEAEAAGVEQVEEFLLVRATLLQQGGRGEAATAALELQRQRFPGDPRAYLRLAAGHAAAGRRAEARRVLLDLVAADPTPASYRLAAEQLVRIGDREAASRLLAELPRRD
jgi:arylsulfatase A-like enzyme